MKTKIINLKQFRQNITKLWKEARKDNVRYIVMFHSTPILEVLPYTEEHLSFEAPERKIGQNRPKTVKAAEVEFYKDDVEGKKSGEVMELEIEKPSPEPSKHADLDYINFATKSGAIPSNTQETDPQTQPEPSEGQFFA